MKNEFDLIKSKTPKNQIPIVFSKDYLITRDKANEYILYKINVKKLEKIKQSQDPTKLEEILNKALRKD